MNKLEKITILLNDRLTFYKRFLENLKSIYEEKDGNTGKAFIDGVIESTKYTINELEKILTIANEK